MVKNEFWSFFVYFYKKITESEMGIVDFSAHQKRVPGSFVLTLFLCIFLFHFNQLNLKIQLFSSHLMVGIKRDIYLILCDNLDRERLSHLVG